MIRSIIKCHAVNFSHMLKNFRRVVVSQELLQTHRPTTHSITPESRQSYLYVPGEYHLLKQPSLHLSDSLAFSKTYYRITETSGTIIIGRCSFDLASRLDNLLTTHCRAFFAKLLEFFGGLLPLTIQQFFSQRIIHHLPPPPR